MQRSNFHNPQKHLDLEVDEDINKIPIKNDKRKCTDVFCIIVGVLLTVALAILAIVLFNRPQYYEEVFPADTDGKTCGWDFPGYNYLYFAQPTVMKTRVCVKYCPSSAADGLSCKKADGSKCSFGSGITFYPTDAVTDNYGMFCLPKDEGQRKILQEQMLSESKDAYYNSVKTAFRSVVVAFVISILYMILVQCCPTIMNKVAVIIGTIALIGLVVTIFASPNNLPSSTQFIVLGIVIVFLVILACTLVKNWAGLTLNGIFLKHSTKFIGARIYLMFLPFLFIAFGFVFYLCQLYQYRSFWSYGPLKFDPSINLYQMLASPTSNYVISAFQILQIIWGTAFLKEAFNYLISAEAVNWYLETNIGCADGPITLITKHFGSVIACAFMSAFFGTFDFLSDALIPDALPDSNFCFSCINSFSSFFDLVRSDAMAWVYMTGNSYCNSARYCEYVVKKSTLTKDVESSQNTNRIYRYTAHFAIAGIVSILSSWVLNLGGIITFSGIGVVLLLSIAISTFFISVHADATEAILIIYLIEEELTQHRGHHDTKNEHTAIKKDIKAFNDQQQASSSA